MFGEVGKQDSGLIVRSAHYDAAQLKVIFNSNAGLKVSSN